MNYEEFKKVPNGYHDVPFWALNGKLNEEELRRQIRVFKEMGMSGAFIHSRCGLKTEYLSDEWMKLVRACVDEFVKNGMKAYLYDEDRWPSGAAGGYATMNPKYRQKSLTYKIVEKNEFDISVCGFEFIAAFGIKFNDENKIEYYYPVLFSKEVKDGDKVIIIERVIRKPNPFFNGFTYLDTLSAEATDVYISYTHERYKEYMGETFGKETVGIFTDEPFRGAMFYQCNASPNEEWDKLCPYTEKLFEEYEKDWGEDLTKKLPELFFGLAYDNYSQALYRYINTVEELFLNNYLKRYLDWCRENKLIMTGHLLHEDCLGAQVGAIGSIMRGYEYFDEPGVDMLREGRPYFWVVKQLSSVGHQLGKKRLLSELYGCTGWQMNFQSYKQVGDWQAICGISVRCPHLSWYTMGAEGKRDYPASIFYQSSWYKDYVSIEDYFGRANYLSEHAEEKADVLVLNPIESVFGLHVSSSMKYSNWESTHPLFKAHEKNYTDMCKFLMANQITFDYGEEYLMAKHGRANGNKVVVGEREYGIVVVFDLRTIRKTTVDMLNEFVNNGGKVVLVGTHPERLDGAKADLQNEDFVTKAIKVETLSDELVEILKKDDKFALSFEKDGETDNKFISTVRDLGNGESYIYAINTDWFNTHTVTVTLKGERTLTKLNLRNGETEVLKTYYKDGKTLFDKTFDKGEELVVLITDGKSEVKECKETYEKCESVDKFKYELSEPNMLVLDACNMVMDGNDLGVNEILRHSAKVNALLGLPEKMDKMVQPWFREMMGYYTPDNPHAKLKLTYKFKVGKKPEDIALVMEQAKEYEITLNGKNVPVKVSGHYIDNSFEKIAIDPSIIKEGENVLELETTYYEYIALEPIYLVGNFGVYMTKEKYGDYDVCEIGELPETLEMGDVTYQGFLFYGGKIYYYLPTGKGEKKFDFNKGGWSTLSVWTDEKQYDVSFKPYTVKVNVGKMKAIKEWNATIESATTQKIDTEENGVIVEVSLSRSNSFGPYHLVMTEGLDTYYSSRSYKTVGKDYTSSFRFIVNGLMNADIYNVKK